VESTHLTRTTTTTAGRGATQTLRAVAETLLQERSSEAMQAAERERCVCVLPTVTGAGGRGQWPITHVYGCGGGGAAGQAAGDGGGGG